MFTKKTFDFLSENRIQNSKAWFDANRASYEEYVLAPLREVVDALAPAMLQLDGQLIVTPRVGPTISRIRRDTRFSNDKSLYRDVMWCVFLRDKKQWESQPGYVFEISPRGWRYGCGYYQADPKTMEGARKLILQGNRVFRAALDCYEAQDTFVLEGDCYKRSKFPDQPENLRAWLDRKSFWIVHNSVDWDLLCSDRLVPALARDFKRVQPIYAFFWLAETIKKREDQPMD